MGRMSKGPRHFSGLVFFAAPGRRVPLGGWPPFFGARLAAPVLTAGRLDPDCCPLARLPVRVRTTRLDAAPAPAGPSRRGARASSRVLLRATTTSDRIAAKTVQLSEISSFRRFDCAWLSRSRSPSYASRRGRWRVLSFPSGPVGSAAVPRVVFPTCGRFGAGHQAPSHRANQVRMRPGGRGGRGA
jgi:hypothetical protein